MNYLKAMRDALAALENLTTYEKRPSNIWRSFYKSASGDYVNLRDFKVQSEPIANQLRAAIEAWEKEEPIGFGVQVTEDGELEWNTIWSEKWAANAHLNNGLADERWTGECHVVPLYTRKDEA